MFFVFIEWVWRRWNNQHGHRPDSSIWMDPVAKRENHPTLWRLFTTRKAGNVKKKKKNELPDSESEFTDQGSQNVNSLLSKTKFYLTWNFKLLSQSFCKLSLNFYFTGEITSNYPKGAQLWRLSLTWLGFPKFNTWTINNRQTLANLRLDFKLLSLSWHSISSSKSSASPRKVTQVVKLCL